MSRRNKNATKYEPVIPPAEPVPGPVLNQLDVDGLRQGHLYLIRGRMVKLALFEGWNDESCLVFSILRDEMNPLCWSEVKYLAGDFDAFEAFDTAGNPPVWIWKRALGTDLPPHWFRLFEEARRRQSDWNAVYGGGEDATAGESSIQNQDTDHHDLRTYIMGSPTEPATEGSSSKQSGAGDTMVGSSAGGSANKSKGGKKTRKSLAAVFSGH